MNWISQTIAAVNSHLGLLALLTTVVLLVLLLLKKGLIGTILSPFLNAPDEKSELVFNFTQKILKYVFFTAVFIIVAVVSVPLIEDKIIENDPASDRPLPDPEFRYSKTISNKKDNINIKGDSEYSEQSEVINEMSVSDKSKVISSNKKVNVYENNNNYTINVNSKGLNLKFDDGQLEIPGIKLSEEFIQSNQDILKKGLGKFKLEKDYSDSEEIFKELRQNTVSDIDAISSEGVRGLITASMYVANKNREGIIDLCKNYYKDNTHTDVYRYDMHAHVRRIAVNEGIDNAEKAVIELKKNCASPDLSLVWISIPLGKMEDLKSGHSFYSGTYKSVHLTVDNKNYLANFIQNYPDDPMVPYAYYFSESFDELIKSYPDGLLNKYAYISLIENNNTPTKKRIDLLSQYIIIYGKSRETVKLSQVISSDLGRMTDFEDLIKLEEITQLPSISLKEYFLKSFTSSVEDKVYHASKLKDSAEYNEKYKKLVLLVLKKYGWDVGDELKTLFAILAGRLGDVSSMSVFGMQSLMGKKQFESFVSEIATYCKYENDVKEIEKIVNSIFDLREELKSDSYPGSCLERVSFNYGIELNIQGYIDFRNKYTITNRLDDEFFRGSVKTLKENKSKLLDFFNDVYRSPLVTSQDFDAIVARSYLDNGMLYELVTTYQNHPNENWVIEFVVNNFIAIFSEYNMEEILKCMLSSEKLSIKMFSDIGLLAYLDNDATQKVIEKWKTVPLNAYQELVFKEYLGNVNAGHLKKALKIYSDNKELLERMNIQVGHHYSHINETVTRAFNLVNKFPIEPSNIVKLRGSSEPKEVRELAELYFFNECVDMDNDYAGTCIFLRGLSNKRAGHLIAAKNDLNAYIERYNGRFADDAYAELGLVSLENDKDIDAATTQFKKAYIDYSDRNAADNALYWLGRYYEANGQYQIAYSYYARVAYVYAKNRLASISSEKSKEMVEKLNGKENTVGIDGIELLVFREASNEYVVEEINENSKFMVGDIVISINGVDLYDGESYYHALTSFSNIGDTITVKVKRKNLTTPIESKLLRNGLNQRYLVRRADLSAEELEYQP